MLPEKPRIRMIGNSGAGKSTLARQISTKLGIRLLEEDAIHYQNHFIQVDKEIVCDRVSRFIQNNDSFVTDGCWRDINDVIMPKVNVIIHLNYPFYLTFWRLLKRTFWRCWTRESLWGLSDCRETFSVAFNPFAGDDSVLWYSIKSSMRPNKKLVIANKWLKDGWENGQEERQILVFHHPSETQKWLDQLSPSS
ncbi:hypothetical protein EDD86DRAFT_249317 [Gorgonomyces haynaldii]|nr:hypothetical protein EDD86DRAFT_249317 [Gorgonomyces haynaldii]